VASGVDGAARGDRCVTRGGGARCSFGYVLTPEAVLKLDNDVDWSHWTSSAESLDQLCRVTGPAALPDRTPA
jgi:hypothetical protein